MAGCQSLQQTLNDTELRPRRCATACSEKCGSPRRWGWRASPWRGALAAAAGSPRPGHPDHRRRREAGSHQDRIDVALRVGTLEDSTSVARRLGQTRMLLCASPAYLARRARRAARRICWPTTGWPRTCWGRDTAAGREGEAHKIKPKPRVLCNNVLPLRQFTLAGQGFRCNRKVK